MNAALKKATAEWLQGLYHWQVFAHLTFAKPLSSEESFKRFTWLCQSLARLGTPRHVAVAWFADLQARGVVHYHCLFATITEGAPPITAADIEARWTFGDALSEPYRQIGAEEYGLRHRVWDVNVSCPRPPDCRRARGCRFAPGPWQTPKSLLIE